MIRSIRPVVGRVAAAGTIFVAPLLLAGPARAAVRDSAGAPVSAKSLNAVPSLGGWNVTADGNAVDILMDNATGLAGIHPLTEADFPEAQSSFSSGPFGSALAAVFWPGSAGGNFGSLSGELGIPSQLQPITSQLNDPVKASAQYPAGPASSVYPPGSSGGVADMKATAEAGGTTAEGAVTNQAQPKVFAFSSAEGRSSATASSTAQGQASSDVQDISIAGLVAIGSVTSTAQANSDGTTGKGSSTTHVSGVTVLGQKASIGSDGLVLPNFANALGGLTGPLVQNAISQVISGLGLTITEFPSTTTNDGAGYSVNSGGVSIEIDPPSSAAPLLEQAASVLAPLFPSQAAIIPTLPGLLQGLKVTITIGRSSASANASTAFVANFNPPPPLSVPPATPSVSSTGGTGGAQLAGPVGGSGGSSPAIAGTPSPQSSGSGPGSGSGGGGVPAPAASLVSLSSPLAAGAIALGLIVALACAYGLWSLGRTLLPKDTDPVCPLGQDRI